MERPFAHFEGELTPERVHELFASPARRHYVRYVLIGLIAIPLAMGFSWFASPHDPQIAWLAVILLIPVLIIAAIRDGTSRGAANRWLASNAALLGPYRESLRTNSVVLETASIALDRPYALFRAVDNTAACVRIWIEWFPKPTAIVLPLADCRPARTADELTAFIIERQLDQKKGWPVGERRIEKVPLPTLMKYDEPHVAVSGPRHLLDQLLAAESAVPEAETRKENRNLKLQFALVAVAIGLMALTGTFDMRKIWPSVWVPAVGFVFVVAMYLLLKKVQRQEREKLANVPAAEAGTVEGWLSPTGVVASYVAESCAVCWHACDGIEFTAERIVARFWGGQVLALGRNLFQSDDDYRQACAWADAGKRNPATPLSEQLRYPKLPPAEVKR